MARISVKRLSRRATKREREEQQESLFMIVASAAYREFSALASQTYLRGGIQSDFEAKKAKVPQGDLDEGVPASVESGEPENVSGSRL